MIIILKMSILSIAYTLCSCTINMLMKNLHTRITGWFFHAALIFTIIFVSNKFLQLDPNHSAGVKLILMIEQLVIMLFFSIKNDEKRKKLSDIF
jgi:hypothetical protein